VDNPEDLGNIFNRIDAVAWVVLTLLEAWTLQREEN
jgi:hypothetical protein